MGEESLKNLDCVAISRNQESLKVNSMKSENGMIDLMLPVVIPADLNCKKRSTEICSCKGSSNDTFLELDAANNLDGFPSLRGYKYERSLSNCSVESGDSYASAVSKLEPETDQEELHKMFKAFDENGDGAITLEELRNTMKKLGFELSEQELGVMVMSADKNGDGRVDFDEFLSLYSNLYAEDRKKDEERDVELLEAFQVFDKNSDGFITVQELHSVLSSLGLKEGARLTDCQSMIRGVDSDGDGRVNFEEFKQMMNSSPFRQSY